MKRHALLVGSFVIGALVLLVIGIIWLSGNALFHQELRAAVYFKGSVNGLYVGAPVTFRGVPVGRVESIGIEVDDATLNARIPVYVSLRPDAVQYSGGGKDAELDLPALVQRGLRARLLAQSFVTGQKYIELDFAPDTPAVLASGGGVPEIPALGDRFDALIDQVAELPLRETVQDLRDTLRTLQQTLAATQGSLDTTAGAIAQTVDEARSTLRTASAALVAVQADTQATLRAMTRLAQDSGQTVQQLQTELAATLQAARRAAESAQTAIDRVSEMAAPGAPLRADLDGAVRDLAQAARSLRTWSEVLEERPNAVIFGNDTP